MLPVSRALVVVGIVASCHKAEPRLAPEAPIVDLSTSLEAFRSEFNAHRGEARFLTLLSPS